MMIFKRMKDTCFDSTHILLPYVHVLDLDSKGSVLNFHRCLVGCLDKLRLTPTKKPYNIKIVQSLFCIHKILKNGNINIKIENPFTADNLVNIL